MAEDEDSRAEPPGDTAIADTQLVLEWWSLHDRKYAPELRRLSSEEEREFWDRTALLLAKFADEIDGGRQPGEHVLLRADPLRLAAGIIGEAAAGISPKSWKPPKGTRRGRTPRGSKRVGMGYARAYLQAVIDRLIIDTAHNKTIRDKYKIDDTTVQKWAQLPLGQQWDGMRIAILRADGAEARLAVAKGLLEHGAHFYRMDW